MTASPAWSSRGRVLVVDDDPAARGAMASLLRGDGFVVSVAASGLEALESIGRLRPDALVSDVHMPAMNGLALLGRARQLSPDLIVVLVSAENGRPAGAIGARANGYLTKPVDVEELVGLLDAEIRISRERARAR